MEPSSVYGPVRSWRVGRSLGVDLLLDPSTCSFRCVYCQLGSIGRPTRDRGLWVPTEKVERDLRASPWREADVVTFSGNGEPTLALNLGACLRLAKAVTGLPSIVLTNGSLLVDPEVRRDLQLADRVFVKLDAVDQPSLARVNRPVEGVTLASILDGTRSFRAEYAGHLAVQVMLLPGCQGSLDRLGDLLLDLRPDEVQLNTPLRPVPRTWYLEARGRHHDPAPVPTSHLKTLTPGEAALAEEHLRRRTGLPVVSVYEPGRT